MINTIKRYFPFFLILAGATALLPFLGSVHLFDWDEANFAELAREMILTKNYLQPQINYLPFYEKPPVFIWMQVIAMKLFGINEFAARFPNAVLGILVGLSLYWIGKREHDQRFGRIWVLTYLGSFLPFMYFRTGLIDPWFNYFMFLSLYFYYIATAKKSHPTSRPYAHLLISALFLGIAVQTKGPAAFIIVFGTVGSFWVLSKFSSFPRITKTGFWVVLSLLFSSLWFVYESYKHGDSYMHEFILYQIRLFTTEDALHGGPIYYHVIVLLLGCFPASFILLFNSNWKEKLKNNWFKMMCICGVLVLVLFSIVQTKIIHYSSMAYYPISYIAATAIYQDSINKRSILKRLMTFAIFLLIVCLISMPILGKNIPFLIQFIQDPQAKLQLGAKVDWYYMEVLIGLCILCLFLYLRNRIQNFYLPYFISTSLIVLALLIIFAPKIERYTQGTYIDFCKSLRGKDVYVQPLFFKSYATLFYSYRKPFSNDTSKNHAWLYDGKVDRDVFFISITKDSLLTHYPRPYLKVVGQKNGYDFTYREINN